MNMLVKTIEHKQSQRRRQLEILQTISKGDEKREFGKVIQGADQLLCIPSMPLGVHMSVHNANQAHPAGRIHHKVEKGVFQIYPPGVELGMRMGETDIPSFADIKGVLRLPPESNGLIVGTPLISAAALWEQSPRLEIHSSKFRRMINIDSDVSLCDGIGVEYFFVEPGYLSLLEGWFQKRAYLYRNVELGAEVFEVFEPWLVVVVARGNFKDGKALMPVEGG